MFELNKKETTDQIYEMLLKLCLRENVWFKVHILEKKKDCKIHYC